MDKLIALTVQKRAVLFLILFILFQTAYSLGVIENTRYNHEHAVSVIKNKILTDADQLPFHSLHTEHQQASDSITLYVNELNAQLQQQSAFLTINSLQLSPKLSDKRLLGKISSDQQQESNGGIVSYELNKHGVNLGVITLNLLSPSLTEHVSLWVVLSALMMTYLVVSASQTNIKIEPDENPVKPQPTVWLQIDLKEKKLRNAIDQKEVYIANKPLCFYCALIDYCTQHPDTFINPNKELPEELLQLTDKYFFRLMDLGHTIRKRPNFSNNIEKTLSEIRAALDDIFHGDMDKKKVFSPPKAIGEGSRSKAHNVSLQQLEPNKIIFIGK